MSATTPVMTILALAVVIGLILLARQGARLLPLAGTMALGRARGAVPRDGLALEQVLALDPRRRLLLVRCGPRRLLLLTGGQQDVVVGWLDPLPFGDAPP
jgi:flagellar protein FliO/FliZ